MGLFNRNTNKKHIADFELKIAELLIDQFPQFKQVIDVSKVHEISFTVAPNGIYSSRVFNNNEAFNAIEKNNNTHFNLIGISVFNVKSSSFIPVKLNYSFDSLTKIEVEEPERFHRNFDLKNIQINKIEIEELATDDTEKKLVQEILKNVNQKQLETLELANTFEIILNNNSYYTILDMEDGNYITVDKSGIVYRLNHDHENVIKEIANSPKEFFSFYNGIKKDLEYIMEE